MRGLMVVEQNVLPGKDAARRSAAANREYSRGLGL